MTALEIQRWALSHNERQLTKSSGEEGRSNAGQQVLSVGNGNAARNLELPSSLSNSPFQTEELLATAELGYLQGSQFIKNEDDSEPVRVGSTSQVEITVECQDGSERTVICNQGDGDMTTDYASECFQLIDQLLQHSRKRGDEFAASTADRAVRALERLLREQKERELRQHNRVAHLQNKALALIGKSEASLARFTAPVPTGATVAEPGALSDEVAPPSRGNGAACPKELATERRAPQAARNAAAAMRHKGAGILGLNRSPDTNPPDAGSALRALVGFAPCWL